MEQNIIDLLAPCLGEEGALEVAQNVSARFALKEVVDILNPQIAAACDALHELCFQIMDGKYGPEGVSCFATQAETFAAYEAGGKGYAKLEERMRQYIALQYEVTAEEMNQHFTKRVDAFLDSSEADESA